MVDRSTRRLPLWMVSSATDAVCKKQKKAEENLTLPLTNCTTTATTVGKKRKSKNAISASAEEIHTNNDAGLTVDDLLAIAKEYVKDSEPKQQSLNIRCESQTLAYCRNGMEDDTVSLASKQSFIDVSRTGDPAQDMLHLFLGPLLKKPIVDGKKSECVTKDLDSPYN